MDLKHGIEILRHNRTFKCILSTLLSVGIFLNGAAVKGFQIEYLAKVSIFTMNSTFSFSLSIHLLFFEPAYLLCINFLHYALGAWS